MAKLLPKRVLDAEMLKELCKYYKIKTSSEEWDPEEFLEWECFSHPSLQYHDCNSRAKLLGGHECTSCRHVPGRPCKHSCDFQHFCLAVFAWRLGIGGELLEEALHNNLYVLNREGLYNEVTKKFSMEEIEFDCEAELEPCVVEVEEEQEEEVVEEIEEVGLTGDLLSVKQAADHYGCTYSNIYNYVKGGQLEYREVGPRKRKKINKDVLAAFMADRKGKRGRKAAL